MVRQAVGGTTNLAHSPMMMDSTTEKNLVLKAQKGDRESQAKLVEYLWDKIYRWLFRLTHDGHTAEDLTQESFVKALTNLHRFKPGTNFTAWVFRIAHNNFVNHCRSKGRIRKPLPDEIASRKIGPVDEVVSEESVQKLSRIIDEMPLEFKSVLLLRMEQDLSFREIAGILDLTEETARWRVFRARQKLLEALEPNQELEKP